MMQIDEHVIVLDLKMKGESVANVVSARGAALPIPAPGCKVSVGNAAHRKTYVVADKLPHYFFADYDIVVELDVEPAEG